MGGNVNIKIYKLNVTKIDEYTDNVNSSNLIEIKSKILSNIFDSSISSDDVSNQFYQLINTVINNKFAEMKCLCHFQ